MQIEQQELKELLAQAYRDGAQDAFRRYVRYNYKEAAKLLSITPKTLAKRIAEKKIQATDGLITGEEINRYLNHH